MPRNPADLDRELASLYEARATLADKMADLTEAIDRLEAERRRLQSGHKRPSVTSNVDMVAAHRIAISAGRSTDPLAAAARKAGLTTRQLAERIGVAPSLLSMARRGKRSLSADKAAEIERLTGYPASKWPPAKRK